MKLDVATTDIVLSNVGTTGEFRIRNSAKAFKILSDGLYSNKIRAVIRELSCNAIDSHIAAKQDKPFEVHLPNVLEPWFSVKDFGLGLNDEQVTNIYTTYFESTKTDSNDFIGALGLGSKSPFSYTDNFTITAIKDGTKYIYSAFISEIGVPSVAEMGKELTDEGNGVEVKFSVSDRSDYNSFKYEAQEVFKWFKSVPTITGSTGFEVFPEVYKEKDIVPGVHLRNQRGSIAIMGNIPYSMGKIAEPEKHFGALAGLLECNLVMEFEIGELDFAASREELSIVPITIASIKRKLELLNANIAIHIANKANAFDSEWARAAFLQKEMHDNPAMYKSAIIKYVADTKFELFDPTAYYGKKTFELTVKALEDRGMSIAMFSRSGYRGENRTINPSGKHIGSVFTKYWEIPVQNDLVFVFNDLKTGCLARARYHYNEAGGSPTVICISHNDLDNAVRQIEYDKLVEELHNPPTILKASELKKREKTATVKGNNGIAFFKERSNTGRWNSLKEYGWELTTDQLVATETYYYVRLNGHQPVEADGNIMLDVNSIKRNMVDCGISAISGINIYGVRKNRFAEISELTNWVPLEDKLKEETAKITDAKIRGMVAADVLDHYSYSNYTNKAIASKVSKDSAYAEYASKYNNLQKTTGAVSAVVWLSGKYGKAVQVDAIKKAINDDTEALKIKYPLLKHISGADVDDIADYIKLVDKS